MPLIDLRTLPAREECSWESFHQSWAVMIAFQLNGGGLPSRYRARPAAHAGTAVAADVAFYDEEAEEEPSGGEGGGTALATWAPPAPPIASKIDFDALDEFEVRICREGGSALVAAIEFVSERNKDRPAAQLRFATKCASYLQNNVSVIVVDPVMERHANLHEEIAGLLNADEDMRGAVAADLYAVSYRTRGRGEELRLEAWPAALAVGEALPALPLWLAPGLAIRLDLETSYRE
ncbi:MAG: hypothetical protein K2W96_13190, partial [Gemmataceae bacterium]|nr:hypothetical protein [Gemmataceae bacterium]